MDRRPETAVRLLAAAGVWLALTASGVEREHFNYMVHCQGCHLADGAGLGERVPPLKNTIARFLSVEGGRAFLVRVPGMSHAHLTHAEKAALLNWLLPRFDAGHMPADFEPYTAGEVERLERHKIDDVVGTRAALASQFED